MDKLDGIPAEFKPEEVLKRLGMSRELAKRLDIEELWRTAMSMIHPKALYTTAYITNRTETALDIGEVRLASRVLTRNLEKVKQVFPYIVTIGKTLEDESSKCESTLQRLYLETAGDLALTSARVRLEKYLSESYGLGNMSHMGPGQLDWAITEQKQLFSIFGDVQASLGVRLTDSFLMIPRKSISGIIFPTETPFVSCQLCPRKNCSSREVAYSESLRRSYGLDSE